MDASRKGFAQKEILSYLLTLPQPCRLGLYSNVFACRFVFRALPPVSRILILRLLGGGPIELTSHEIEERTTLIDLNLCIFSRSNGLELSPVFHKGISHSLVNPTSVKPEVPPSALVTDSVEDWARQQWDDILHFLVRAPSSSSSSSTIVGPAVKRQRKSAAEYSSSISVSHNLDASVQHALCELSLYSKDKGGTITSLGYEFILKDVFEEVWTLVQYFLSQSPDTLAESFSLLFELAFCQPGDTIQVGIPVPSWFHFLGLMRRVNPSGNAFVVSSLGCFALKAPSRFKKIESSQENKIGLTSMRIVVETTFKVYCYTTSAMHCAMLQLFCRLEARLPNLVVCVISRESVARAFHRGISAEQILLFLEQNADPITYKLRSKLVPDNVADQIFMWKKETQRLRLMKTGVLVEVEKSSKSDEVFAMCREVFKDRMDWTDSSRRFFVSEDSSAANAGGGPDVKTMLNEVKKKLNLT